MAKQENPISLYVQRDYHGHLVTYREDGWFNATEAAARFGKHPGDWLDLPSTDDYLSALCRQLRSEKICLLKVIRGGRARADGTWFHPKLAVPFARWLDDDFAVWCDLQIDSLLREKQDWRRMRHEAAASYKVMSQMLKEAREHLGKDCETHHFMNEAKLVNWALQGEFRGIDRDTLSMPDLDLLSALEVRNSLLIARGLPYAKRKPMLEDLARQWRLANQPRVTGGLGPSPRV